MKITILTTSLSGGGAAIAALRHYEALRAMGCDVRMIALKGDRREDAYIDILERRRHWRLRGQMARFLERVEIATRLFPQALGRLWRFSSAHWGIGLSRHPWVKEADIIHLHWVNHGLLSLSDIRHILSLGKPVVWTLHDLWPTTGGCHLPVLMSSYGAEMCPRYLVGCGGCPLVHCGRESWTNRQKSIKDLQLISPINMHFVAVSSLVARWASQHLSYIPVVIPPPLPLGGLDHERHEGGASSRDEGGALRYILVSAARLDDDVKGPALLREVMKHLVDRLPSDLVSCVRLRLVGEIKNAHVFDSFPIPTEFIGLLAADQIKSYYEQSRVVLSTSLFETFGQTLSEALALGVPVVSFDMVGMVDLIRPKVDGDVVPAYDTEAMADAILPYLLPREVNASERIERSRHLRASLSPQRIASLYLEFYRKITLP